MFVHVICYTTFPIQYYFQLYKLTTYIHVCKYRGKYIGKYLMWNFLMSIQSDIFFILD